MNEDQLGFHLGGSEDLDSGTLPAVATARHPGAAHEGALGNVAATNAR